MATSSISNILDILKSTSGGKSTITKNSSIDQTAYDAMLRSILGSTSGLASVAGNQKIAGLYNSSTNQLLTNDLLTRSAGEVASQNKSETTTQTTSPAVARGSQQILGKTIAGLELLSEAKKFDSTYKITDKLKSVFDSTGSSGGDLGLSAISGDTGGTFGVLSGGDSTSYLSSVGQDYGSGIGDIFGLSASDAVEGAAVSTAAEEGAASSGIGDYISSAWDSISSALGSISSYLGFADGGKVPSYYSLYAPGTNPIASRAKLDISGEKIQPKPQPIPEKIKLNDPSGFGSSEPSTHESGVGGYGLGAGNVGAIGLSLATGNLAGLAMGMVNAYSHNEFGKNALEAMFDAVFGTEAAPSTTSIDTDVGSGVGVNSNPGLGSLGGVSFGQDISSALGISVDDLGFSFDSPSANNSSDSSSSNDSSSSTGTGPGDGNAGDAAGGTDGSSGTGTAANGARIPGHDMKGKDNIPIRVSGGEVVLPTDVVDAVESYHPGFFDALISQFHTPIRKAA